MASSLCRILYDPATVTQLSTASLLAMTAMDTTNLRITFTAGSSGNVQVRIRCTVAGGTSWPGILLGVLQSSTVIGRQNPISGFPSSGTATTVGMTLEASFGVTGLTPGNQYTWDAAYAVQTAVASSNINYGGPNDASGADAWGGIAFEIYDAPNLLAAANYDPTSTVTKSTTSNLALTAIDTTNLRLTFTAPASGNVFVRLRCGAIFQSTSASPVIMLGILQSSSVIGRASPIGGFTSTTATFLPYPLESELTVGGLSGSYTWDASYAVQRVETFSNMRYGGPNDASGADAYGMFQFEIWSA